MPINILMPALSPTMTEGTLSRWLKIAGDHIAPGDVIAEIETDKATMEVEAVEEGRIADIRVVAGTANVAVNTVIAVMLGDDETEGDIAKPDLVPPVHATACHVPEAEPATGTAEPVKPTPRRDTPTSRIIASPLARRIAGQQGIDLSTLTGSGPNGRIVKADLTGGRPSFKPANDSPQPTAQPATQATPDHRRTADLLGMKYAAQPNSGVRKTIARRLSEAKQQIPHFYLTVDVEIDMVNDLRRVLNARDPGGKISVNDFVIKAAAMALKQVPAANASWTDSDTLLYEHADISVAVATDNGLITPIIKAAEGKTLPDISREMKELGIRARAGKLKPEEFQGGSFSVSNLGMYGIREFSAIINPPQACILAVGAGEQRPVVRNGALAIATVMTCTLSVDHRAVDGAVGAQYLAAFKKLVEDPLSLVL